MLVDASGNPYSSAALAPRPSRRAASSLSAKAWSPYFATQDSPSRGFLWTFAEDTRRQLAPWSRTVMMLKSRTLVENYGPAKALWHLARLIGALKPQSRCEDAAWAKLAEESFSALAYSPRVFDAAGRFTFETAQVFSSFRRKTDGDLFGILTETAEGHARVAFREAHCVASPLSGGDVAWCDGVKTDPNGFPLAYAFRASSLEKARVLPFQNVHHFCTWTTGGGTRGVPALSHWINDAHDLVEIKGFTKHAIKIASTLGLCPAGGAPGAPQTGGIGSGTENEVYLPPNESSTNEERPAQVVKVEDVFGGGIVADQSYEVLADPRPHQNVMEFRREMLRECAIGEGVPPAIMFFLDDPGGALVRAQLDIFAKYLLDQYVNHLIPFCQRFWTYFIAKEMKAGRLPYPSKGEWWKVRWMFPRSLTADMGRMGRLAIELRKALMTSLCTHYEELGLYWEDEMEQCAKEYAHAMALETKYGLPAGSLTSAFQQQGIAAQPSPESDEGDKKKQ